MALASLFGSTAVQAVMSGQGAVAVAVSGVQVLSATASVWGTAPETVLATLKDGEAEERSALIFFALSTLFLLATTSALAYLMAMPAYKDVVGLFDQRQIHARSFSGDSDERRGLVSSGRCSVVSEGQSQIWRVAKANLTYEIAVAYIFIVTLVSHATTYTVFILLSHEIVRVPTYNDINNLHEPGGPSPPLQRLSFSHLQYR